MEKKKTSEALKFLNALSRDKDKIKCKGFIHLNTAYLWLSNGRPRLRIEDSPIYQNRRRFSLTSQDHTCI